MQSSPVPPSRPEAVDSLSSRTLQRFGVFWTLILYVGLAFGVYGCYVDRPALLRGWAGVGLFGLIAAFCSVYHLLYQRRIGFWPIPFGSALLYAASQTLLLWLLSHYSQAFAWLAYALLAHIATGIPVRQWPLPIAIIIVLLADATGLYTAVVTGNWIGVVSVLFSFVVSLAIYLFIQIMVSQRFRFAHLVVELRQAQHELEERATQTEELAALRERTRLAREMHDNLGHALVLVNVKLEAAQRLYVVDAARGAAELDATKKLVRDTMNELRRSLANLRSPFSEADLCVALQRLAAEAGRRADLAVTCTVAPDLPSPNAETAKMLWYVAREALTNTERHAAAHTVNITLTHCDHDLVLRVSDDGTGLKLSNLNRAGHYGITGMRERAEAIGGTLTIGVRPEGGTLVEARVPVEARMTDERE